MKSVHIRPLSEKFPEPEFSRLQRVVFADMQQISDEWGAVLRDETTDSLVQQIHSPIFRVGAYSADELVGWSFGWMERGRVFCMANSGVIASYRRQGIYTALLSAIREFALLQGAIALRSQHSVVINPVIIAKLRAGFNVSGLSQSAQMGALVELTLNLSQQRQKLYTSRVLPYVAPGA
jgi:GNAT superfamily N-acetyltransferase